MNIFSFFIGMKGEFIQTLLLLPVLVLLLVLSLQLLEKRKRRSYAILFKIAMGHALFNIIFVFVSLILSASGNEIRLFSSIVNGISNAAYIAILYGLFRIHNKADLKANLIFIGPVVISAFLGIFIPWLGNVFCLLSIGVILLLHREKLGRGKQILIASCLFGGGLLISIVTNLVPNIHGAIYMISRILPIASYTLLLITLLQHTTVIMQSSYFSSITDPLTGLFNRRYFTRFITACIKKNKHVNVIFSDIDNFKNLNTTKGHLVGDEVLKQVASIFMEEVEGIGIAGRYGGEEMVMLIQDTDVDMNELTERMRARIEKETIVTVSIGYCFYEQGVAPEKLIKYADDAMYIAKDNGKNRVEQHKGGIVSSNLVENGLGKAAMNHG